MRKLFFILTLITLTACHGARQHNEHIKSAIATSISKIFPTPADGHIDSITILNTDSISENNFYLMLTATLQHSIQTLHDTLAIYTDSLHHITTRTPADTTTISACNRKIAALEKRTGNFIKRADSVATLGSKNRDAGTDPFFGYSVRAILYLTTPTQPFSDTLLFYIDRHDSIQFRHIMQYEVYSRIHKGGK